MRNTAQHFKTPAMKYRPRLRFWWPGGYVAHHLAELDRELMLIAQAGFGGVEISDVYDAVPDEGCDELQPDKYGFTSENWKISVKQALKSARNYGLSVDLTVGPHWPATTNEATPNETGTAKELVYGSCLFSETIRSGTALEDICPPHYQTSSSMTDGSPVLNKLIALYIAEEVEHSEVIMPPPVPWGDSYTVISDKITFDSLRDISDIVKNGSLICDVVPEYSDNVLIAVYQRGTGQRANMFLMGNPNRPDVMAPFAYVVDHFAPQGAELIKQLWEKHFLNDKEFVALLKETGDCFFEDSLELQSVGHWTDNMLTEFKQRRGYSLKPYLPFVLGINQDKGLGIESLSFQVEPEHSERIRRLRHDYFLVLNELYQDYHLKIIKEWAHTLGMKYRAQPYGWAIDSAGISAELDITEGESLGFGEDGIDSFRMLAAGRDFGGLEVLSDEAGAYFGQGYATPLPQLLTTLYKNYMGGVNQTFWHGFPFKYAPAARWPGFSAFSPMLGGRGFAESWGERQPVWQHMDLYTTCLARVQQILRYGRNQVDVLLYQAGHNASENKKAAYGDDLTKLGYRYQVMTEGLFDKQSTVHDRRLVVKGGSYSLLLMPAEAVLTDAAAAKLKAWEKAGLPVVRVHERADVTKITEILGESIFANASGDLYTYRRVDEEHDFIICYNQGPGSVPLNGLFRSHRLTEWQPWSGIIQKPSDPLLRAGELRIFAVGTGQTAMIEQEYRTVSLAKQSWRLVLEKWEMVDPRQTDTRKTIIERELDRLVAWTDIEGLEHCSGIGRYRTTFMVDGSAPDQLIIPGISGSMTVSLNGHPVAGNPLTGCFDLDKATQPGENELEITIGSTLNNYLNDCPLTDFYSRLPQQKYGITEDVLLLYSLPKRII